MADGEGNDSAANDVVQLEAMCKDGLSWHPCQVSLCSRGLGVVVLYGHNNMEEIIKDKREISARIRVRSTPLKGDDCSSIRQGENVLAAQNSHVNGLFYDARVEKAIHVRHTKRSHCRCSFTIKWLNRFLPEAASTVPASAIMKLATKSINLHPTISAFFSMQESLDAFDAMPCSLVGDSKNWEIDISMLLEQQIKKISTSTHIPPENILDFTSKHKVELQEQSHGCETEASLKDSVGAVPLLDRLKSFNGSENNQTVELISETPPATTPSIQEKLTGSRLLNPLAARAALASLRSEFPQSPELSAQSNEKRDMPQGSIISSFSAADRASNAEDFSLKISATLESKSPNLKGIVKNLFPTSSPPHIVEISTLSSGARINGMEKSNEIGEMRSSPQVQRGNGMREASEMTNNNETQSKGADTRRVTRSRVRGAEKGETKDYNTAAKDHCLNESTVAPHNCLSDDQRTIASAMNGQINIQRVTRSRVKGVEKTDVKEYNAAVKDNVHGNGNTGKVGMVIDIDIEKGELIQNAEKHHNQKRLTRSAAANEDTENKAVQHKQKQRKSNLSESNISSTRLGIQKSLTENNATNYNVLFSEEVEIKKKPNHVESTPKSSDSSNVGSQNGTRKNSANSKKKETRFSPRLRYLPRTRSQNKA